jgi:hypothetical protein
MRANLQLAVVLCALFAGCASAEVIIDFSTGGAGKSGTVSYTGGSAALTGSGIAIGSVSGTNTPIKGPITITSGTLSFSTGAFKSDNSGVYTFASGGSLTITGTGAFGTNTTLLKATNVAATFYSTTGILTLTLVGGSETVNSTLLSLFGEPSNVSTSAFLGSVSTTTLKNLTKSGNLSFSVNSLGSTNVQTDVAVGAVPEPASIVLLFTVLAGVVCLVRRQPASKTLCG